MYKRHTGQVSMLESPDMFGSLPLDPNNDWIKLSKLVPWREFDLKYADNFRSKKGQRAIDSRMALGALLIKPAYKALSDEDITKEIAMNPYLQYFLGLHEYRYCKEHEIHLNGPKLGKPFTDPEEARRHKKLEWLESGERGEIERNFGVGKRRYSLDCIVTKLKETSEVMIHSIVIFMNLLKRLRLLLRSLFNWLRIVIQNQPKEMDFALA